MPAVLNIIRNRWTEVLLIVVVQTGLAMLMLQIVGDNPGSEESMQQLMDMPAGKQFGLTFGASAIWVIWIMLGIGFLATACKEGTIQQQPSTLLIAGRYFFWRLLCLYFAFTVISMIVAQIFWQFGMNLFPNVGQEKMTQYASMAMMVALVKPMLLMPSIIIVKDCNVIASFKYMAHYRLLAAKGLIKLIAICYGGAFLLTLIFSEINLEGTGKLIGQGIDYTLSGVFMLSVYVGAVGYIASLEPEPEPVEEIEEL